MSAEMLDNKNIYLGENAKLTLTKVTSVLTGQSTFSSYKKPRMVWE